MRQLLHPLRAREGVGSVGMGLLTWAELAAAIDTATAQGLRLLEKLGRARNWRVR